MLAFAFLHLIQRAMRVQSQAVAPMAIIIIIVIIIIIIIIIMITIMQYADTDTSCARARELIRYILRDYLRIRLRKLSQFPVYYLDKDNQALLSSAERIWLHEYWDNKSQLLQNRFLGALPGHLQSLTNDDNAPMDMVRRPSIQKHVYARICGDLGQLTPSPTPGSVAPTSTQQPLELVEGETYLVQYSVLRKFLMEPDHDGKVELI
ncbi:DNA replication complex GINS protein SLD5 [Symbiodinium microadriaticum]|uniref:DNA replication complex GINS protein SLD5 n=1 Tax=Symbiodinium microadriaticum TaxID=2951 RepID=A0A1Q9D5R6_SYMMI|nr:DNA replication complex GINS protein SLD5 [Symbiodinium microadriaticum]